MTARPALSLSNDLARIVWRIEKGDDLGAAFCDRLTRSVAQLFGLAEADCSDEDRASFDRILVRIAPTATIDARHFLSDRLAASVEPPRSILLFLANDVVDVARPILERSPALADDDLIDIARSRGVAHMGAIAVRREIAVRVTDILVLRGDDEVRRFVVDNPGAHISDKGFARLSLQSRTDTVVETRLVARGDLPDVVVHFLLANGSEETRETLARREAEERSRDELEPGTTSIRAAEEGWLEPYDFGVAAKVLLRMPEVRNHVDGFIRRLAQSDRFPEIVHILAAVSGLRLETMKHVLVSLDTEPFAVVARALALQTETVRETLSAGPWLHRLTDRSRMATLTQFRSLDADEARARLHRWLERDVPPAE